MDTFITVADRKEHQLTMADVRVMNYMGWAEYIITCDSLHKLQEGIKKEANVTGSAQLVLCKGEQLQQSNFKFVHGVRMLYLFTLGTNAVQLITNSQTNERTTPGIDRLDDDEYIRRFERSLKTAKTKFDRILEGAYQFQYFTTETLSMLIKHIDGLEIVFKEIRKRVFFLSALEEAKSKVMLTDQKQKDLLQHIKMLLVNLPRRYQQCKYNLSLQDYLQTQLKEDEKDKAFLRELQERQFEAERKLALIEEFYDPFLDLSAGRQSTVVQRTRRECDKLLLDIKTMLYNLHSRYIKKIRRQMKNFDDIRQIQRDIDKIASDQKTMTDKADKILELTVTGQAKNRDEGYGGSRSAGVKYNAVQGAAVQPRLLTSASASDLSAEIRSLVQETRQVASWWEEKTAHITKIEECEIHSSG
ncbi:uncharacterized protein LOC124135634 isoform X2 [Haliotis rufescens]|uniref:uncharacterized protein LOC124135634 isoform X2 n=1 Tax=Haliotis rufescens TaxID=6454 RepID=UPI001EB05B3C|nr:uncharacterized protein LOC124135634 isoform X2 [Haliotis rufescens]